MNLKLWLEANLARIALFAVVALIVIGLLFGRSCQHERTAKTQVKLDAGHIDATTNSAIDALDTSGNRAAVETRDGQTVQETKNAINNATDASGVTGAGVDGLRRLGGHQRPGNTVQPPRP